MQDINTPLEIKAIMGLGNPGPNFINTPHNIGFLVVDALCRQYDGIWVDDHNMQTASVMINDHKILLIKPQTYMNNSGDVLKHLQKRGIKLENILVVHDEIDFVFNKVSLKYDGSARGHNGLRSLIAHGGSNFVRVRCGVGRPNDQAQVGNFVTARFEQTAHQVDELIDKAVGVILKNFFF